LGPFLLPSNSPGGAELAPVVGPAPDNNLYIADPARVGPVTGSPLGPTRNFVRIEGPAGSNLDGAGNDFIETTDFTLMGRIFTGSIPSEVTADRAEYTRNSSGQKVEVYATGFESTQGRVPGQAPAGAIMPVLSFFDAPCTSALDNNDNPIPPYGAPENAVETQMLNAGNSFWALAQPADIPVAVCVKDNVSLTYFPKAVVDEVTVSQAYYNPAGPNLSVIARSSDEVAPPTLTLGGFGDLSDGTIVVSPLAAPPAKVQVFSSAGGVGEHQVSTVSPAVPAPASAVTLTAEPPGTAQSGDNVAFTGLASGGSGSYEYQFMAAAAGSDFVVARPYAPTDNWVWDTTGSPAGAYIVQVFARSIGSAAALEALGTVNYTLTTAGTAPTSVTLEAVPADNTATGNSVTYTATVNDGTGPFEYEFRARVAPAG
ncbi:MAG: hypothetical protein IH610_03825, partial [Deltaproteobacteria bacterium]|nr:hypothetical protein [Deltaproteobacteria bacterium]